MHSFKVFVHVWELHFAVFNVPNSVRVECRCAVRQRPIFSKNAETEKKPLTPRILSKTKVHVENDEGR